jgi:acyl-CoA synthetase (NDP forming)
VRIDTLENLFEIPALLADQKPAKRHRVAVMTTTGGGAASVADRLGTYGVDVVAPTAEVIAKLAAQNVTIGPRGLPISRSPVRKRKSTARC